MDKKILTAAVAALTVAFGGCNQSPTQPEVAPTPENELASPELPFQGLPNENCQDDHLGLGTGLIEDGQVHEGVVELEKGVACKPRSFDLRKALGEGYLKLGNLSLAVGHLQAATDLGEDFSVWQELAEGQFQLKDYDRSVQSIQRAVKLDRQSPRPWRLLARVYLQKEMWQESIDASEEAIGRGSDSPWTYNNLGLAYLVLGRSDDAIRELEKAVSFEEGVTAQIWNNLGLAYEREGRLADAAEAYRTSLAGGPTYVKAKVNLQRVVQVARATGVAIGPEKAEVDFKSILRKDLKSPDEVEVP